jgi:hypothetical protein
VQREARSNASLQQKSELNTNIDLEGRNASNTVV